MSSEFYFLYDQIVEQCARLQAFCSMRLSTLDCYKEVEEDIETMLPVLAKRDLLILAAVTRNFADAANAVERMKATKIQTSLLIDTDQPPFLTDANVDKCITLYQCLSRVLHATIVRVLRTKRDYDFTLASDSEDFITRAYNNETRHLNDQLLDPALLLATKQDGVSLVLLSRLLAAVHVFIHEESELLAERTIYVSHSIRHL